MGCIVNGPGEAKECELGLAGGNGKISLFKYGKPIATYREEEGINALKNELMKFTI
jgi:(E)-4-hydroxy-3-methylbut-2-enyl-diphosphate synthase